MIDLEYEKKRNLTTKQICQIEDFAAQAANDNGFFNSFVFERALVVFSAQMLFEEKRDQIASAIGNGYDISLAFDMLVEDGTVEKLVQEYGEDLAHIQMVGEKWFKEAETFEHSARGLLNSVTTLSGDIVKSAAQQLQKAASGDAKVVEEFARNWGLDRKVAAEDLKEEDQNNLFSLIDGEINIPGLEE